eukprot:3937658-Rhodomonas_salina.1
MKTPGEGGTEGASEQDRELQWNNQLQLSSSRPRMINVMTMSITEMRYLPHHRLSAKHVNNKLVRDFRIAAFLFRIPEESWDPSLVKTLSWVSSLLFSKERSEVADVSAGHRRLVLQRGEAGRAGDRPDRGLVFRRGAAPQPITAVTRATRIQTSHTNRPSPSGIGGAGPRLAPGPGGLRLRQCLG